MAVTRRGCGNKQTKSRNSLTTQHEEDDSDTIHVQKPLTSSNTQRSMATNLHGKRRDRTPSSTGGMEDISLTSPTLSMIPLEAMSITPGGPRKPDSHFKRTYSPASRDFALNPPITTGSALDPIEISESPPRCHISVTKIPKKASTPHKFRERHHKFYEGQPDRTPLAPKPANVSTFTGDKIHDIYRMMSAKTAAYDSKIPPPPPHAMFKANDFSVPFDRRYPKSAQFLVQQTVTDRQDLPRTTSISRPSYPQHHKRMALSVSGDGENILHKKAIQHVRHHSQNQGFKNNLSNTMAGTGMLESNRTMSRPLSAPSSTHLQPPIQGKIDVYTDPQSHLSQLITQTSLLTSLLKIYPTTTNKQALRNDISQLASIQATYMNAWLDSESHNNTNTNSRKRRRSNTDSAISVGCDSPHFTNAEKEDNGVNVHGHELEEKMEVDEEIRKVISSSAAVWQDGSGIGVADVFAVQEEGVGVDELDEEGGEV